MNLTRVLARIEKVCREAGRQHTEIELVAVTKYATAIETAAMARAMHGLGLPILLGESRVQALAAKAAELTGEGLPLRWEMIGNIQRNKARLALHAADRIHSLDRNAILERMSDLAQGRTVTGFLQVNISAEENKHGYRFEELQDALEQASSLPGIEIRGLMGMAGQGTDHRTARPVFGQLREWKEKHAPHLPHLSMGMTRDYLGAIHEGATVVRIGSALFASAATAETEPKSEKRE